MGPEYFALGLTAVISSIGGGSWVANKILSRASDRVKTVYELLSKQENRLNSLENQVSRLPLEYVLKVDFLREIQEMHDNFRQINLKLDKLVEKLFTK
jgi:aspartyl/asparaginyl beta-hydroxylase (cupin superfamily)